MTITATTRGRRLAGYGASAVALSVILVGCASSGGGSTSSSAGGAGGAGAASSGVQAGSSGSTTTVKVSNGHLTDGAGRTLYLWVADTGKTSTCSGQCAVAWPPLTASAAPSAGRGVTASDLDTSARSDGTLQVTYAGHPLYYFKADVSPGQAVGQGSDEFGAKWWEVAASGQAITPAGSGGASSTPKSSAKSSSSGGGGGGYAY